jgi:serine/threonine protein kinase
MNGSYSPGAVILHNWTLKRLIGEGSFGRVYEADYSDKALQ